VYFGVWVLQLSAMLAKHGQEINNVFNFDIPDSVLEERITGRWVHLVSGRSYHSKFAPPKVAGIDDVSSSLPLVTIHSYSPSHPHMVGLSSNSAAK